MPIDIDVGQSLASAFNFDPWGQPAVIEFARELGRALVADGTRIATGLGILAIDIHNVRDPINGTDQQGRNPLEHWSVEGKSFTSIYRTYDWVRDDGYNNIARWIETAAQAAGR